MKRYLFTLLFLTIGLNAMADDYSVNVSFEENTITLDWSNGSLRWSAQRRGTTVVAPSRLNMETSLGVWGEGIEKAKVKSVKNREYNAAVVSFNGYAVELRAYEDGVAYRFISNSDGHYTVINEMAEFSFNENDKAWVPYVNFKPDATSDYATQYYTSFENTYNHVAIKDIDWRRLMFTPAVVEHENLKLCLVESNLEDYPGIFLSNSDKDGIIDTEFAPLPDVVEQGDYNMLQGVVMSRKPYIAECNGERTFPWRGVIIADSDAALASSNLVWKLADECRIKDTSWI